MASDKMVAELNKQINAEVYSAYLYLSMSAYASDKGLPGVANWLAIQAKEELSHSQMIYNFVLRLGKRVVLQAIDQPPSDFDSPLSLFEKVLEHEQKVTALIGNLADLAVEEKDHATKIFLQWFVTEQVEEEENVNDIIATLRLAGEHGGGLFMVDKELGQRVFTPPAAE